MAHPILNVGGVFVYKEVMMSEEQSVMQVINDVFRYHDPQQLAQLSEYFSAWDGLLKLREIITGVNINPHYYDVIFSYFWHEEPNIAKMVRTIVLFNGGHTLTTLIEHFLEHDMDTSDFPYNLSYNSSEKEFHIDLPDVPGMVVSHYGRDNPDIDRLLSVLEKVYARLYPDRIPPGFRQ